MLNMKKLTKAGIKLFGHIFTTDFVPLLSDKTELATLEEKTGLHEVYKIDLAILTIRQKDQCYEYMAKKRNIDKKEVEETLTNLNFIPIEARWFVE